MYRSQLMITKIRCGSHRGHLNTPSAGYMTYRRGDLPEALNPTYVAVCRRLMFRRARSSVTVVTASTGPQLSPWRATEKGRFHETDENRIARGIARGCSGDVRREQLCVVGPGRAGGA